MNNRIKNVVLICSLLFNLTLIIAVVYKSIAPPPPPKPPIERAQHHRDSNNRRRPIHNEIREQRQLFLEAKKRFYEKLGDAEIDKRELEQLLEELIAKQSEMEKVIGSNLIEMRQNMSEEEARRFFHRRMEKGNKSPRRQRRR